MVVLETGVAGQPGVDRECVSGGNGAVTVVIGTCGAQYDLSRTVDRGVLAGGEIDTSAVGKGHDRAGAEAQERTRAVKGELGETGGRAGEREGVGGAVVDVDRAGHAVEVALHDHGARAVEVEALDDASGGVAVDAAEGERTARVVVAERGGDRAGRHFEVGQDALAVRGVGGEQDRAVGLQGDLLSGRADRVGRHGRAGEGHVHERRKTGEVKRCMTVAVVAEGGRVVAIRERRGAPVGAVGPVGVLRAVPGAAGGPERSGGQQDERCGRQRGRGR
ncbi:MAG: hypothetical protein BWX70_02994 [Verrucomicrobia bacterium ADurb.Bin070]|nr:MAG: hypothetical protein BWX70_02994 [Verrucomicrobia bacterium ADurb.Bin070]